VWSALAADEWYSTSRVKKAEVFVKKSSAPPTHMYTYIYIYLCIDLYLSIHTSIYIRSALAADEWVKHEQREEGYIYTYIYIYIYIYLYIYLYICISIYTHIYIYDQRWLLIKEYSTRRVKKAEVFVKKSSAPPTQSSVRAHVLAES